MTLGLRRALFRASAAFAGLNRGDKAYFAQLRACTGLRPYAATHSPSPRRHPP